MDYLTDLNLTSSVRLKNMRASRLLSILLQLQTYGRMTAERLAERFEVSVRTIYRDVDHLCEAGVPIYADRGRTGGFKLLDGFRSQLIGLTPSEAETLFLAGLPGAAREMGLSEVFASARTKLLAAIPSGAQAEKISARFHLDPLTWFRQSEPSSLLPEIARATWGSLFLEINYKNDGRICSRRIGPLGIVLKAGIWYLVAQRDSEIRTYRVSQITEAVATKSPFSRPKGFVLADHWAKAAKEYESNTYTVSATVRLSPQGVMRLRAMGDVVASAAAKSAGPPDRRGWVTCIVPLERIDTSVRDLLSLGVDVEVLTPTTLRRELSKTLNRLAKRYQRPSALASAK